MNERRRTAPGALPHFVVIGAQKSGTTSLNLYLRAHPNVHIPAAPVYFFDRHFSRGVDWYKSQFAPSCDQKIVGEGTPEYLYMQETAPRLAATIPNAKLLAVLRHPADRAYSHYWHNRTRSHEPLEFGAALEAESKRLADPDPFARARYAYSDRGRYLGQLQRFCSYFPRESLQVILSDDLRDDRARVMQEVYEFVGVAADFLPPTIGRQKNQFVTFRSNRLRGPIKRLPGPARRFALHFNSKPATYPAMPPEVRAELVERFRDENAALMAWLSRDVSHWNA